MLTSGLVNDIFLVDGAEVVRFPKLKDDRRSLLFEVAVLNKLDGKVTLTIPKPIQIASDGSYGVFSYVAGEVLSDNAVSQLSEEARVKIGRELAQFTQEINRAISISKIDDLRQEIGTEATDEEHYYDEGLKQAALNGQELLLHYRRYYQQMRSLQGGRVDRRVVIHGDLHAGNLVFNTRHNLTGIIDFGDFGTGTVYDEFYQIYSLDEVVAKAAAEALTAMLGPINLELVRTRAILHELSVLVRPSRDETYDGMRMKVARHRLERWLGSNWGEP